MLRDILYPPFRNWLDSGDIWFLSDLHFDDADCRAEKPKWISAEEQVEILNEEILPCDTFVCLGDVGRPARVRDIRAGKKILILGNHDNKEELMPYFDEIYDGPLFIVEKILLSHESVKGLKWCLNIHGHNHSVVKDYGDGCRHINLAACVCGYKPVKLQSMVEEGALLGLPRRS